MHTQEINFSHMKLLSVDSHVNRYTWDKAIELIFLSTSNSEEPVFFVSRRCKGPLQEFNWVIKPKHIVIIFNIILSQEIVYFFTFFIVLDVHVWPMISCWDIERLFSNISYCFWHINLFVEIILCHIVSCFWHWLRVPEIMSVIQWGQFLNCFLLFIFVLILFLKLFHKFVYVFLSLSIVSFAQNFFQLFLLI